MHTFRYSQNRATIWRPAPHHSVHLHAEEPQLHLTSSSCYLSLASQPGAFLLTRMSGHCKAWLFMQIRHVRELTPYGMNFNQAMSANVQIPSTDNLSEMEFMQLLRGTSTTHNRHSQWHHSLSTTVLPFPPTSLLSFFAHFCCSLISLLNKTNVSKPWSFGGI